MRIHSRINITPSGVTPIRSATIGNLWTARVNHQLARASGGTFVIEFEDVLIKSMSIQYRDDRRPYCEEIVAQLANYGVSPSPPDELAAFDMPIDCGVMLESDYMPLMQFAWKHLLPFRKAYGEWPAYQTCDTHAVAETISINGGLHPFILLSRALLDWVSMRSAFVNGDECAASQSGYALVATMLYNAAPQQNTIPVLRVGSGRGDMEALKISVSSTPETNPFYVGVCLEAGLTYHELFGYLEAVAVRPGCNFRVREVVDMLGSLEPWPVIVESHWRAFLKADTKKRQVMIDEVKAR
jgi:hypothetical protein